MGEPATGQAEHRVELIDMNLSNKSDATAKTVELTLSDRLPPAGQPLPEATLRDLDKAGVVEIALPDGGLLVLTRRGAQVEFPQDSFAEAMDWLSQIGLLAMDRAGFYFTNFSAARVLFDGFSERDYASEATQ